MFRIVKQWIGRVLHLFVECNAILPGGRVSDVSVPGGLVSSSYVRMLKTQLKLLSEGVLVKEVLLLTTAILPTIWEKSVGVRFCRIHRQDLGVWICAKN
jgi:hypothetical protein